MRRSPEQTEGRGSEEGSKNRRENDGERGHAYTYTHGTHLQVLEKSRDLVLGRKGGIKRCK